MKNFAPQSLTLSRPSVAIRSERARLVARWFGIDVDERPGAPMAGHAQDDDFHRALVPAAGEITLIAGPSGAGKSSLLRRIRDLASPTEADRVAWIDLAAIELPNAPAVDCFGDDVALPDALKLLCRAGLGEAWSYLRTPSELSEGQRWRLKLAVAIERARQIARRDASSRTILVCDEFAAVLDRITACIIAQMLRRAIGPRDGESIAGNGATIGASISALVATSHDDLIAALQPDIEVNCDFASVAVKRNAL